MSILLEAEAPPIRRDEKGVLRVGETRLLVDLVIHAFNDGATPEEIVQRFPVASLAQIYGIVSYYLSHREEIDQYLAERQVLAGQLREEVEQRQRTIGTS